MHTGHLREQPFQPINSTRNYITVTTTFINHSINLNYGTNRVQKKLEGGCQQTVKQYASIGEV